MKKKSRVFTLDFQREGEQQKFATKKSKYNLWRITPLSFGQQVSDDVIMIKCLKLIKWIYAEMKNVIQEI